MDAPRTRSPLAQLLWRYTHVMPDRLLTVPALIAAAVCRLGLRRCPAGADAADLR
jgi:hypothetical protein